MEMDLKEINELLAPLDGYDSINGENLHHLFDILLDLNWSIKKDLENGDKTNAINKVKQINALIWIITEKVPQTLFDAIEDLHFYFLKLKHTEQ